MPKLKTFLPDKKGFLDISIHSRPRHFCPEKNTA
jgi:hypothetical protein